MKRDVWGITQVAVRRGETVLTTANLIFHPGFNDLEDENWQSCYLRGMTKTKDRPH